MQKRIDDYLKEMIEVNRIPGTAVAVIKNGEIIFEKNYGKNSIQENTNVGQNSIIRLYFTY